MLVIFLCCCIVHIWLCSIGSSLHTLNQYTVYSESWRYEFQEKQVNDSIISIIDPDNNAITLTFALNTSFLITINNNTIIDYFDDNDWNEIHHLHSNSHNMHISHRRRLFLGFIKRGASWLKKRLKRFLKRKFGKVAIPPPRRRRFWNKKWIKKGRYIGYFPGYGKQRGLTYKEAASYCDEHFGGLATIFSAKENTQVFGICRELLKKYKRQNKCRRKCKHIIFRGKKCWQSCKMPYVESLYAKKHWKGHNCWIGLQLGKSEAKEQFSRWNDMHLVHYRNWGPEEPSYRTIKRCKRIFGTEEKQCETERRYDEQCAEILGWKAGTKKVKRSSSRLFKGVPAAIQNQIAPKAGTQLVSLAAKWNNARCKANRVPICQRARGQVYDKYIVVRAKRTYDVASEFCANWYGTTLATIVTDTDAVKAMEACQKVDVDKGSCWIGLQRPFKKWDDATATVAFENWAKGEPNNAGYYENCVEMNSGSGKWNDLACNAKRYFVCNMKTKWERTKLKERKKIVIKRYNRHRMTWNRYRRKEYRAKIRKMYMEKVARFMRLKRKKMMLVRRRRRDSFRQNMFDKQYGGFVKKVKMGYKRRRMMVDSYSAQHMIDDIHERMERNQEDDDDEDIEIDLRCKVMNGLYQFCIDGDGVEIRKYIKNERKLIYEDESVYNILSNHSMSFMKYEDIKYELMMNHSDNMSISDVMQFNSYYIQKTIFEYDLDNDHRTQCLPYLDELQLCLELKGNEMMIDILKSKKIVLPSKLIQFSNDEEWNEIDVLYLKNRNIQRITKCTHIFDAKVCVECKLQMSSSDNDYIPLSYSAVVLIQEV